MRIAVCIKQVPGTTEVETDKETGTLKRQGVQAVINPFDQYVIEEGVKWKDKLKCSLTAVTMGPPSAEFALRQAIACGCENGLLLSDRAFAGADTLATSYVLAHGIKSLNDVKLIICGLKTTDGDTGQVGAGIAETLQIPNVCYVYSIDELTEDHVVVQRYLDDRIETLKVRLPCLITVSKDINIPRMPTLKARLDSEKAHVKVLNADDLGVDRSSCGIDGSPTQVLKVFAPEKTRDCMMLSGDAQNCAKHIVQELKKRVER